MANKTYVWEAEGILSGDHECFCLASTKYECLKVNQQIRHFSKNPFHKGLYNLYPNTFSGEIGNKKVRYRLEIEVLE